MFHTQDDPAKRIRHCDFFVSCRSLLFLLIKFKIQIGFGFTCTVLYKVNCI